MHWLATNQSDGRLIGISAPPVFMAVDSVSVKSPPRPKTHLLCNVQYIRSYRLRIDICVNAGQMGKKHPAIIISYMSLFT